MEIVTIDSLLNREKSKAKMQLVTTQLDISEVYQKAKASFASRKTIDVAFRKRQLLSLKNMLREKEDVLVDALFSDLRRPSFEAKAFELYIVASELKQALHKLDKWVQPKKRHRKVLMPWDSAWMEYQPLGVVLIIGAWNFPFILTLVPLIGAIAAGNCAIIKPSEGAPAASRCLTQLLADYLDNECYHVVEGDALRATELLQHKFDYIFYTGSSTVGRIIHKAASRDLTPITLELGGKSPVYLDESANLEVSLRRILWAKCMNLGQVCIAPDYLLCTANVEKMVIETAPRILREFYGAVPKASHHLGRIATNHHWERIQRLLSATRGRVLIGGGLDGAERWVEPTLVFDVDDADSLMQEELFAPILPVVRVSDAAHAIHFIQQRPKPLVVYLFAEDKELHLAFRTHTSSGQLCINDTLMQFSVDDMPFGGIGESGMGAYRGYNTFRTFSHLRSVIRRDMGVIGEKVFSVKYAPFHLKKLRIIRMLVNNSALYDFSWFAPLIMFMTQAAFFICCGILIGRYSFSS